MAKWGEGDPRWIVEERPDATNVNNWHWSEKDAGKWSQDRLKALLLDVAFEADGKRVRINEVDAVAGEAFVNNRKAKLIYLYDWKITGKWEGIYLDSSFSSPLVSGTFEINGLSDENDIEEVDIEIATADTSEEGYAFKSLVRNVGVFHVRQSLQQYVDELKRDFAKDLIKPVTKTPTPTTINTTVMKKAEAKLVVNGVNPVAKQSNSSRSSSSPGQTISTTSISLEDSFRCEVDQLYEFFTDARMIGGWTKSSVQFELTKDSSFRLFDGNVSGVVLDFEPSKSLKLRWRFKSWRDGHFSEVNVAFNQGKEASTIRLEQSGVPQSEAEATTNGWKINTFRAIKAAFGVGHFGLN